MVRANPFRDRTRTGGLRNGFLNPMSYGPRERNIRCDDGEIIGFLSVAMEMFACRGLPRRRPRNRIPGTCAYLGCPCRCPRFTLHYIPRPRTSGKSLSARRTLSRIVSYEIKILMLPPSYRRFSLASLIREKFRERGAFRTLSA